MKNLLLLILAIVLSIIFYPLGILYALFKKGQSTYFRDVAESIDQLGNVVMSKLFNQWMVKSHGWKHGNIDETVSSVMGKNQRLNALTPSGRWLNRLLNKIDKDHSIKSIEENP